MKKEDMAQARESLYYDIHGLLGIQVNRVAARELVKDINQPLSYFATGIIKKPDIVLNIGEFTPDNGHCDVVDHKIYVKKNYLYSSDFIGKTKCSVEIAGLESSTTTINVWCELKKLHKWLIPDLIAQNVFLRPIIDFKLVQKNILSIHAAGYAKDDKAVILSGRGGAFKTTLVMDMIRHYGYHFVGEDRLLLGEGGHVYAYPVYHKLFTYRLKKMETENYQRLDKLKYFLFQRSQGEHPDYIADHSSLQAICSIVKYGKTRMASSQISKADMVEKMVMSQKMENINSPGIMGINDGKIYEYFCGYAYRFPDSQIASYWNDYSDLLSRCLTEDTYKEIGIPKKYDRGLCGNLMRIVDKAK